MTLRWSVAVVCLAGAVLAVSWPSNIGRARRRAVIGGSAAPTRSLAFRAVGALASAFDGPVTTASLLSAIRAYAATSPRRSVLLAVIGAGCAGLILAGPVAAVAFAAYGGLAVRTTLRRWSDQLADRKRRQQLDDLCALAADLRAGLPVTAALAPAGLPVSTVALAAADPAGTPIAASTDGSDQIATLARAASRLAERTGAPLADLVERIEADARTLDRGLAAARAQAAGAQATAWLLAALPLGGIALGYGIGVDPLHVLLNTPIGAGCAMVAIVLQLAGLAWTDRLGGSATRAA